VTKRVMMTAKQARSEIAEMLIQCQDDGLSAREIAHHYGRHFTWAGEHLNHLKSIGRAALCGIGQASRWIDPRRADILDAALKEKVIDRIMVERRCSRDAAIRRQLVRSASWRNATEETMTRLVRGEDQIVQKVMPVTKYRPIKVNAPSSVFDLWRYV
jgi:hypothetical protein